MKADIVKVYLDTNRIRHSRKNISEDAIKMVEHQRETYCLVKVRLEDFTKISYKYKVVNI